MKTVHLGVCVIIPTCLEGRGSPRALHTCVSYTGICTVLVPPLGTCGFPRGTQQHVWHFVTWV